jgi:ornithine cyclodeaminase
MSKQTLFLDVHSVKKLVQHIGVVALISEVANAIEKDFINWKKFQLCSRVAHHGPLGVVEIMPVANDQKYSFKYVTGHPKNPIQGLSTVIAFGVLSDFDTGFPSFLSELTFLTAIRTAAMSVVAAKPLVRKGATSMAMIGNGAQSEFQILAFHHMLGVSTVNLYDIDQDATNKLINNLSHVPGLKLVPCSSTQQAVAEVDIITTCTADKTKATILTSDMVKQGVHINAIGGDCPGKTELASEILDRSNVFVEYEPQTRIEGEIQQKSADFPVTELWQVLDGTLPGRVRDNDITIFDSVGFAIEDYSVLRVAHELAITLNIGELIDLVAVPPNVKDLYGFFLE